MDTLSGWIVMTIGLFLIAFSIPTYYFLMSLNAQWKNKKFDTQPEDLFIPFIIFTIGATVFLVITIIKALIC